MCVKFVHCTEIYHILQTLLLWVHININKHAPTHSEWHSPYSCQVSEFQEWRRQLSSNQAANRQNLENRYANSTTVVGPASTSGASTSTNSEEALPNGWEKRVMDNGREYYVNHETR